MILRTWKEASRCTLSVLRLPWRMGGDSVCRKAMPATTSLMMEVRTLESRTTAGLEKRSANVPA